MNRQLQQNRPTLVVHGLHHRPRVIEFFDKIGGEGASIHFDGKYPTWLIKPDEKGGTTIGKVIDASGLDAVQDMIRDEFYKAVERKKAALRASIAKMDAEDAAATRTKPVARKKAVRA